MTPAGRFFEHEHTDWSESRKITAATAQPPARRRNTPALTTFRTESGLNSL
jgi:hypothetical protein